MSEEEKKYRNPLTEHRKSRETAEKVLFLNSALQAYQGQHFCAHAQPETPD